MYVKVLHAFIEKLIKQSFTLLNTKQLDYL